MRLLKLLSSITVILLFISCSNDEDNGGQLISKYNRVYMHHENSSASSENKNVYLEYTNDKVIRRFHSLFSISIDENSGFDSTNGTIYEDVEYIGNEITTVKDIDYQEYTLAANHRRYVLDEYGRIIKKVYFDEDTSFGVYGTNTIDYEYDANGLLTKTYKNRESNQFEEASYFFNEHNNLEKIVRSRYYRHENGVDIVYSGKTEEVFSEYDNSYNPLQHLGIFDELFYRSLSANNYARYDKYEYSYQDELINHEFKSWDFYYDGNGNIRFDLF